MRGRVLYSGQVQVVGRNCAFVHEERNDILGFAEVLEEVWSRRELSLALEIGDVYQLVVVSHARIRLALGHDGRQGAEVP